LKKEVKILKKVATNGIEKRVVSGKARSCKIVSEKVSEVYDDFDKRYLPLDEFLKLYNEKGERLGVENVKDVKESVSDVSQIKLVSEEDIEEDIEIKEDIGTEIEKDIGTEIEKDIGIEEDIENINPYEWYIKKLYRK